MTLKRSGALRQPTHIPAEPDEPTAASAAVEPSGVPAVDMPELQPLWAALRRGTKRSKMRQLVAVCTQGHTLLEVFPTATGPVMIWQDGGRLEQGERTPVTMMATHAGKLDPSWEGDWVQVSVCRCQERAALDKVKLGEAIRGGARRVVAE